MSTRNLLKLPVLGLIALAAACAGADEATETSATVVTPLADAAIEAPAAEAAAPVAEGNVIEVKIRNTPNGSGVYEPAQINAKKGDIVRFVMAEPGAHNVAFPAADNPGKTGLPADSPYMTSAGQSFDLKIEMEPGTYKYVCTPHAAMGMTGEITVSE